MKSIRDHAATQERPVTTKPVISSHI
jgi:hypothetical protein